MHKFHIKGIDKKRVKKFSDGEEQLEGEELQGEC